MKHVYIHTDIYLDMNLPACTVHVYMDMYVWMLHVCCIYSACTCVEHRQYILANPRYVHVYVHVVDSDLGWCP